MKSRSKILCDHSLGMALAAIEIYNKPNFNNREQIFSILMISAWESLLKSKIVKDHSNHLNSIYVKQANGRYKKNRRGENLTIGIDDAILKCNLPEPISQNIKSLVRIRDAAIHLTANSKSLPYIVFSLGTATLRNYAKFIDKNFGLSLSDYNFYILPLGFTYPFQTMTLADFKKEPESISKIIKDIENSKETLSENDDYFLICEIQTTLVSAKKITDATDIVAKVDPTSSSAVIVNRKVNIIDQYPLSWTQVYNSLRLEFPDLKRTELNNFIKENKIKGNSKYSAYNFRNKSEEAKGPGKNTAVIYNHNFLKRAKEFFETESKT